jgi:hypothetical protein
MADKVKVNIYMSPDMLSALKRLARMQDVPYAEVVRAACRSYIVEQRARIEHEKHVIDKVNE